MKFDSSRHFEPRFSCRRSAATPPASEKNPSPRKDGSALPTENQPRYHLDAFPLFRRLTLHPLTSSPALHKQVIDMAGVPLRQGHRNEEHLPYENGLAIESRDLSWLLHRSTPGSIKGKRRVTGPPSCGFVLGVAPCPLLTYCCHYLRRHFIRLEKSFGLSDCYDFLAYLRFLPSSYLMP
jgi:hypothetical protein